MRTSITSKKVIKLINRAFDSEGSLINPKSKKNINEAKSILESGIDYYNKYLNDYDVYNCLLIIAYPDKEI